MGAFLGAGAANIAIRYIAIRDSFAREMFRNGATAADNWGPVPLSFPPKRLPRLTEAALRMSEGVVGGDAWPIRTVGGDTWAALFDANGTMLSKPRLLPA